MNKYRLERINRVGYRYRCKLSGRYVSKRIVYTYWDKLDSIMIAVGLLVYFVIVWGWCVIIIY